MGRRYRFLLVGLIAATLVGLLSLSLPAIEAQQCTVRTDWPTYTVQRGDTLGRIARRYNTTVQTLAQANCLTNINRIFGGQQLRVPPTGGATITPRPGVTVTPAPVGRPTLPEMPQGTYTVGVTSMSFELGFMVWNSTTGSIWVFYQTSSGATSGTVANYPLSLYGGLSIPRRPDLIAPPGRALPTNGFARVWYNFNDVCTRLGFATSPEQGYQMLLQNVGNGQYFVMTTALNSYLQVNPNGTWSLAVTAPPTSTPAPTLVTPSATPIPPTPIVTDGFITSDTATTYQAFQNGFMTWTAGTGEVRVFFGTNGGDILVFGVNQYGNLPIDASAAPPGFIKPANGFGKVWSNFAIIRNTLGWATGSEVGYLSRTLQRQDGRVFSFTLPDGRVIMWNNGSVWSFG